MGLFDKKFCDICGEKIGLLGNRKLEDGNICKDCAKKLSPFFSERKQSTVAEIKEQLAYREENEKRLASFRPTRTYGDGMKVYIDETAGKFVITRATDWRSANPDIIDFSQVSSCNLNIREDKRELYYDGENGERQSYYPPRFECTYQFFLDINVNSPWFSHIEFEYSTHHPDSQYTDLYRKYEREGHEICDILLRRGGNVSYGTQNVPYGAGQQAYAQNGAPYNAPVQQQYGSAAFAGAAGGYAAQPQQQPMQASGEWVCQSCGCRNSGGKFCQSCGGAKPVGNAGVCRCNSCGWSPTPGQPAPRFCPQCGTPLA